MTISSISGNTPADGDKKGDIKQEPKQEEQKPVSIYHKLDTDSTDGQKKGEGIITAAEFKIAKKLDEIEKSLRDFIKGADQGVTGVTFTVASALLSMVTALKSNFKYDFTAEGFKAVDAEKVSRENDLQNIESITKKLGKNDAEAAEKFKKTQFGLLDKPENIDIDPEHNKKAKEIVTKEENEKINKKHQKDLDRIFEALVEQRKNTDSIEKLEKQNIPFEKGQYFIRRINEKPIYIGTETKGETRTETGAHKRLPDMMRLTIEYEYTGADGQTETAVYVAETRNIPADYATRYKVDDKTVELKEEDGELRWN